MFQRKRQKRFFYQLTDYLSNFAKKNQVILVVTHAPCFWSKRNKFFKEVLCESANVVVSIKKFKHIPNFVLEKHPSFELGKVEFPSGDVTLHDFVEA